jgi:hypothetical protein
LVVAHFWSVVFLLVSCRLGRGSSYSLGLLLDLLLGLCLGGLDFLLLLLLRLDKPVVLIVVLDDLLPLLPLFALLRLDVLLWPLVVQVDGSVYGRRGRLGISIVCLLRLGFQILILVVVKLRSLLLGLLVLLLARSLVDGALDAGSAFRTHVTLDDPCFTHQQTTLLLIVVQHVKSAESARGLCGVSLLLLCLFGLELQGGGLLLPELVVVILLLPLLASFFGRHFGASRSLVNEVRVGVKWVWSALLGCRVRVVGCLVGGERRAEREVEVRGRGLIKV